MRYYIAIFLVFELLTSFYFYTKYARSIQTYHSEVISSAVQSSLFVQRAISLINDEFHSQNGAYLGLIVSGANSLDAKARESVRQKLIENFMEFYISKNLDIFGGMHIFDREGKSLLRFHQPYFYDDYIIDKRHSLQKMQREVKFQSGLEIGIYDVMFRYQYPLFFDGDFVGSYEYSVDYNFMMNEMNQFGSEEYSILFESDAMQNVMLPEALQSKFKLIAIGNNSYYISRDMYKNILDKKRLEYLYNQEKIKKFLTLNTPSVFDYSFESENYSAVILPVLDISQRKIASMIVTFKDEVTGMLLETLLIELFLVFLLNLGGFLYLMKQIKNAKYVYSLLNMQKDILIVTDGGNLKDANQAFLDFFGVSTLKEFQLKHDCICDFFLKEEGFVQKYNDGVLWVDYLRLNIHQENRVKIKNLKSQKITIFAVEFESYSQSNSFIVFKDITLEYEKNLMLHKKAEYDVLTKIYNRTSFEERLLQELKKSSRYNTEFSLLMFDIDHFKNVNDSYGHDIGDVILQEIAQLVKSAIRETDYFARWGGEEFMIISQDSLVQSEALAQKLRKLVEEFSFTEVGHLTVSFGLTQYHKGDSKTSIVKRCDTMLYSAKEAGRNCVASVQ